MNGIRHYTREELVLEAGHRGLLHRLEEDGLLDAEAREVVIERLLKAHKRSDRGLLSKEVGWLVLMVGYARRLDLPYDALRARCEILRDYPAALEQ